MTVAAQSARPVADGPRLSPREQFELVALIAQAWPYRHGPYGRDAAKAIVGWAERLPLSRLEEELDVAARLNRRRAGPTVDELVELLRRTDSNTGVGRRAA